MSTPLFTPPMNYSSGQGLVLGLRGLEYDLKDLPLTPHARDRLTQRGITLEAVQMALGLGLSYHAGGGCTAYYLSEKAVRSAFRVLTGNAWQFRNIAVIVSSDGAIVSAYRPTSPLKSWRGRK